MTMLETSNSLNPRSDPASPWWHIDISPVLATLGLGIVGLLGIYSATRGRDDENYVTTFVERQTIFLAIGLVLVVVTVFFDYRWLLRLAPLGFMATLGLLALVLIAGVEVNGAVSWFEFGGFRAQPSEFAKIGLIVAVAALLSRAPSGPLPLRKLAMIIGVACLPIVLVVRQPDLGTAMVMLVITAAMLMVGRAEAHHLVFLVLVAALAVSLLINSTLLEDYQRARFDSFLDPESNSVAAYNQEQAQVAIGNGGITGRGFGQGTQTKSGLVPEQQTDFIFTVIAEEFGFVGGTAVLAFFALLLWRLYRMARLAGDAFGSYLITGVFAMFAFQMFQSIGMTMGIMPVTGIPLPFVSSGGSSVLASYIAVGIALSVHMRRFTAGIDAEVGQLG
ncbi:MAG: rod shape-determining protein RodA [Acidimicrobiales bacterium]|jgi:rod shape determining protein RodA